MSCLQCGMTALALRGKRTAVRNVSWAKRGHWKAIFEALARGGTDDLIFSIDSTSIKAHRSASGGKASAASFSPTAIERAEHGFSDTIGCMIAGRNNPATLAAARAFETRSGPGSSAVVTSSRTDAATAALINGIAARALDFDDNFHGATTHASAVLILALLAGSAPAQPHYRSS